MPLGETLRRRWKWLLLIPVVLVVLIFGGTFVYIHFIAPDPAPPLAFSSASASNAGDPSATAAGAIDGAGTATDGSKVQSRVHEVLNGQDNEATGTSSGVPGTFTVAGTTINTATATVDMTT